jgi:hypothetical protein
MAGGCSGFYWRILWNRFVTLFSFCFLFPGTFWGASVSQQIMVATKSCQSIDASFKKGSLAVQFFTEAGPEGETAWKKFDSLEEAQKACPRGCFENAQVYLDGPLPVLTVLELKSPTKEWVQHVRYYFREDGTLQKTHSEFKRFGAYEKDKGMEQEFLVKVLRDRFYGSNGKLLKKMSPRYFNTSTMREMKNVVFVDGPWPIYLRTKDLPFYDFLNPTATPEEAKTNHVSPPSGP